MLERRRGSIVEWTNLRELSALRNENDGEVGPRWSAILRRLRLAGYDLATGSLANVERAGGWVPAESAEGLDRE
jgi:hypothetical protein